MSESIMKFLDEQIKYYNKLLIQMKEEGYSQNDREKVEHKIWHCEELQERYLYNY